MPHDRVTVVVVGAGLMGRWHAYAIRRAGRTVAGVVDPDPDRAQALAARHRNARSFTTLDRAFDALAPQAVHVCTPLTSHRPVIHAALDRGCHVLSEKPLAASAAEARELLAHAEAAKRLLVPVHQFAWQRGFQALRRRLGEVAPIVQIEMGTASAGALRTGAADPDTVAAEILPHFLTLTRRTLDLPLSGADWTVVRPRVGEWRITGRFGAIAVQILVSMTGRPTFAELRVLGERGSAHLDLFHDFAVFEAGTVSRAAKVTRPFGIAARSLSAASRNLLGRVVRREPAYPGLAALVREFYLAVGGDAPSPVPPYETLDIAEAWDRLKSLAAEDARR